MKGMLTAALASIVLAAGLFAQAPQSQPAAEQARIGYFAGQWNLEGESKPSPMGPGGRFRGTETCEWFAGGFHLVCRTEGTGPKGPVRGQSIMGYDPSEKTYTYYAINSLGEGFFIRGTLSGQVWTWTSESKVDGKLMRIRATTTEQSPTSTTFKLEASFDGGPWAVLHEARGTKVR